MVEISTGMIVFLVIIGIWEMVWKGFALWKAGQNKHLGWFIAILIINTAGILPIIYLVKHPSKNKKYVDLRKK